MPSEVPDVISTRSADTWTPRATKSAAAASRASSDARRRRVAVVPVAHRLDHRLDQMRRREEAELVRIADVQVADASCRSASTFLASATMLRMA